MRVGGESSIEPKRKHRDQVRDAMRDKQHSVRAERAYIDWIRLATCSCSASVSDPLGKRYILFHDKRHPRETGAPEIAAAWVCRVR
jgi:hypothetical protein